MSKQYDKLLQEWAHKWKQEHLSEQVRHLISQANCDLYYGPIGDGSFGDPGECDPELYCYPGFTTAIQTISQELQGLPSELYLDTDSGEVSETEPQSEVCETCNGTGEANEDSLTYSAKCDECQGQGGFEAAGYWWHVERPQIRQAIVGKELSNYLR